MLTVTCLILLFWKVRLYLNSQIQKLSGSLLWHVPCSFIYNNLNKPHSLSFSVYVKFISDTLNISVTFSWDLPSLAMSLLYWKGRYIIPCYTIKFGQNALHFYPFFCWNPEPTLYPPQCAAIELSWCKWFRKWALLLQREKYESIFQSEFGPLQNVSNLILCYERYAQFFSYKEKTCEI